MGEEEGKVVMSREVLKTLTLMLRRQFMEAERTAPVTGRYKENIVLRDCPSSFTIHTILGFLSQLGDDMGMGMPAKEWHGGTLHQVIGLIFEYRQDLLLVTMQEKPSHLLF